MMEIIFWILILGILWRVPEYKFLIFFIVANNALYTLIATPGLAISPDQLPPYLIQVGISDLIFAAIAIPFIAFRKWQRTQKSGAETRADRLAAAARAEN